MNGRSHYDVLGVPTSASAATIRESYRRLARVHHPDQALGSAAGGDKMPMINEAYRVLSDPGRRAVYDASRREAPRPAPASSTSARSTEFDEPPAYTFQHPEGPARIPWRGLLFCSAIAIIAIIVLAQFSKPSGPPEPDNILRTGECVEQTTNGAVEVRCTGNGDLVVRQVMAREGVCPGGVQAIPDRQGMVSVCLEQMPVDPTVVDTVER